MWRRGKNRQYLYPSSIQTEHLHSSSVDISRRRVFVVAIVVHAVQSLLNPCPGLEEGDKQPPAVVRTSTSYSAHERSPTQSTLLCWPSSSTPQTEILPLILPCIPPVVQIPPSPNAGRHPKRRLHHDRLRRSFPARLQCINVQKNQNSVPNNTFCTTRASPSTPVTSSSIALQRLIWRAMAV